MPTVKAAKPRRADAVGVAAVELARHALDDIAAPRTVGEHLSATAEAERVVTHRFACTAKAYPGWVWAVTVARPPRAKTVTVCETELLAGPDAVVAPDHVPWQERLRPGDLGPGDVLEKVADDDRLVAGFEATGDEDVDAVALWELGLGRPRVLSAFGREDAAQRWQEGAFGPSSDFAQASGSDCATCGFLIPLQGALRPSFGLCANEWSPADGRVVSLGFGCGAHSESNLVRHSEAVAGPVLDELALDELPLESPEPVTESLPAD